MKLDDFEFELAPERIALEPASPRDSAKMLCVLDGAFSDRYIMDLADILRSGDLLVVNNSRVIRAQLQGVRPPRPQRGNHNIGEASGVCIHVNLIKRIDAATFDALVKPAKRLAVDDIVQFGKTLSACVIQRQPDGIIRFTFNVSGTTLDQALEMNGEMPLPPYIAARRPVRDKDTVDYQTVYAKAHGSVAAPTAGLHFSESLLTRLDARGVEQCEVTLHVGAGTFLPVKTNDIDAHKMHAEWGEVSAETASKIAQTKARGGRIVAVGTTALRLMESAVDRNGQVQPFSGETDIFIKPGYLVQSADLLLTNFHLPKSTLLMLVAAFAGYDRMRAAYARALASDYRFFSYGDGSLWTRAY